MSSTLKGKGARWNRRGRSDRYTTLHWVESLLFLTTVPCWSEYVLFLPKTSSLCSSITSYTGRIPFFPPLIHFLCLLLSKGRQHCRNFSSSENQNPFIFGRTSVRHLRVTAQSRQLLNRR